MLRFPKLNAGGALTFNILSAQAATGTGTTLNVNGYRYVVLKVSTGSNTTLTFKVQASASETAPDFSAAQSTSNHWTYIGSYDADPATLVAGATGVSYSGVSIATGCKLLFINADLVSWINVTVTAFTGGSLTVDAIAAND